MVEGSELNYSAVCLAPVYVNAVNICLQNVSSGTFSAMIKNLYREPIIMVFLGVTGYIQARVVLYFS